MSDSVHWEDVSAYVVVFSVEDRSSFSAAIDRLYEIRQETCNTDHHQVLSSVTPNPPRLTVILVANKVDLVRNRVVLEQGRTCPQVCQQIELIIRVIDDFLYIYFFSFIHSLSRVSTLMLTLDVDNIAILSVRLSVRP